MERSYRVFSVAASGKELVDIWCYADPEDLGDPIGKVEKHR
jgi:hypothetical protein